MHTIERPLIKGSGYRSQAGHRVAFGCIVVGLANPGNKPFFRFHY
jgi:hypothetical protein